MNTLRIPKMSLVSQYDDLCRNTRILINGCENEFKTFVENHTDCFLKLKTSQEEVESTKKQASYFESENKRLEIQIKHLKSICETEINRRVKAEEEKISMVNQINLIKEVLLADGNAMDDQTKEKLVILSTTSQKHNLESLVRLETIEESAASLLSISDFDKTDDDLDCNASAKPCFKVKRSRDKTSYDQHQISPKRKKSEEKKNAQTRTVTTRAMRFNSEPPPEAPFESQGALKIFHKSESGQLEDQHTERKNTVMRMKNGRYSTEGRLTRSHAFCTKTVIRAERCYPCGRFIKFCKQALKCQDCRVTCHPECKDKCLLPCVPAANTPTKGNAGTVDDYTSEASPMIPAIIVNCINEIESRGLNEVGLYRISGSEREVKDLKEKLLTGRNVPSLRQIDVHVLCGTVKEFLRSLKEPLIPKSAWKRFIDAADIGNEDGKLNEMSNAVYDLPQANKDTMAFLVLHLQRIAASSEVKMPVDNLAKIFGPTIVGYSSSEPSGSSVLAETKYQFKVMHQLLKLPCDYWRSIVNLEPDDLFTHSLTPNPISTAKDNTQRSLSSGGLRTRGIVLSKMPLTPRSANPGSKNGKRYFTSPLLK